MKGSFVFTKAQIKYGIDNCGVYQILEKSQIIIKGGSTE